MIQMDLTTATPDDKAACFGEAFRNVRMLSFRTSATGVMLTTVLLNGAPVVLVGDPEEALARRTGKYTAWGARQIWLHAFPDTLTLDQRQALRDLLIVQVGPDFAGPRESKPMAWLNSHRVVIADRKPP